MPRRLETNVLASVVNAVAVLGASLVAVPLILAAVGTAGFGVWSLGLAILVYASMADAGLGPAIQRFTAVAKGADDDDGVAQLVWTMLVTYAAVGAIAVLVLHLSSRGIVSLFDLPIRLRADAAEMFRHLGFAVAAGLLASGAGHIAAGLERFEVLAVSSASGAVVFVVGVAMLASDHGLTGVATALVAQQSLVLVVRLVSVSGSVLGRRPSLVPRAHLGRMVRFSVPVQVSALADLVNSQSDKIVVGLIAVTATLGQLGIGAQFADGGRLIAAAALGPVVSTLAVTAGRGDAVELRARFGQLHRVWILGLLGAGIIGAASLRPLIEAWLGRGHAEAGLLGGVLVIAVTTGLTTGSGIAYLRAIGRPGLEARYGLLVVAVNAALTIPLAFAAGARGVVLGTLSAYAVGALYFTRRLNRVVPASPVRDARDAAIALTAALAAGAMSFLGGSLAVAVLPGRAALPVVALVDLVALAGYAAAVLGRQLTTRSLIGRGGWSQTTGRRGRG